MNDRQLKRAGLDYWQHVQWKAGRSWREFQSQLRVGSRLWFIESGGPKHYAEVAYEPGDYLVFGRETVGLPEELVAARGAWKIPMTGPIRSLNLANAVSVLAYGALMNVSPDLFD